MSVPDFDQLYRQTCEQLKYAGLVEKVSKEFQKQSTDFDRASVALRWCKEHSITFPTPIASSKCDEEAKKWKERGNEAFRLKRYEQACLLYTTSAKHAVNELAIAYANRSAALFFSGNYELSLQDIRLAFAHSYPSALAWKLWERKAKCLSALKWYGCSEVAYNEAITALQKSDLSESQRTEKEKSFQKELSNEKLEDPTRCSADTKCRCGKQNTYSSDASCPVLQEAHSQIPSANDVLDLVYSPELGRHTKAKTKLNAGDIIIVEKPYASILLPDYFDTHCHNCYKRSLATIPCSNCATAQFCCEYCRDMGNNSYHKTECKVLHILRKCGLGKMSLLAFRIVVIIGETSLLERKSDKTDDQTTDPRTTGFVNGLYRSDHYNTIYNLVGHSEKRSVADLFKRTFMALYMLHLLDHSGYFSSEATDDELQAYTASILLRHLQNLPCNAHEIGEMVVCSGDISKSNPVEIGAGAYAVLSLLNHSCDPNVVRHYYGDVAVVRAIRPIAAGDEIVDNYGYHYAVHEKSYRLQALRKQYFFECNCHACANEWALYQHLPKSNITLKCPECVGLLSDKGECGSCHSVACVQHIQSELQAKSAACETSFQQVLKAKLDVDIGPMAENLAVMDKYLQRPLREYNDCQEFMKQLFAMKGNVYFEKGEK